MENQQQGKKMAPIDKNEQYYAERNQQYVRCASETNNLAELCSLRDYHPDHGRVPEFWLPLYAQFFEMARDIGAAQALHEASPVDLPILEMSAGATDEKLAQLLCWEKQPMRSGELFHRWRTPGGSILQGRPYWSSENGAAFNLAADLDISTSYKNGYAIASFTSETGQAFQVRQLIAGAKDKTAAMRQSIALAAIAKLEQVLEQEVTTEQKNSPNMGL